MKMLPTSDDDIDFLLAELPQLENKANSLIEKVSVDPLGAATRDYSNKILTFSSVGIVISTFGELTGQTGNLFGLGFKVTHLFIVPIALIFVIVFYAVGLGVLAFIDVLRWKATYRQNSAPLQEITIKVQNYQKTLLEKVKQLGEQELQVTTLYPVDELGADGIPLIFKERVLSLVREASNLTNLLAELSRPLSFQRRLNSAASIVFLVSPIGFGIIASILLAISAITLYPN
jgi:hypothetical protein